jgi:glycyl-tRNA synthetase beta chain
MKHMATDTLIVELFTEELPPKALLRLATEFAAGIANGLRSRKLLDASSETSFFATPRRLGVLCTGVMTRGEDTQLREKILPISVAFDAQGAATLALTKKLASLGLAELAVTELERGTDGKAETLYYQRSVAGLDLADALQATLDHAIASLPIPKAMSYQLHGGTAREQTVHFVRPVHALVAVHGSAIVPVTALGLSAGRHTGGHRFMGRREITIEHARDYVKVLAQDGKVVASFDARCQMIREKLLAQAGHHRVIMPDSLVEEVAALVEWPEVYEGQFEQSYLEVPQQCLILTMQQHQRYFAMTDQSGAMVNRFLVVSNLEAADPSAIVTGNQRVLRARLADAKFFYDQDRKQTLESRLPALDQVVYHNKLGTLGARVARLEALALAIAGAIGADKSHASRAARLAKADLSTDMVGEFPELQGIMGHYYATHDHESDEVAVAIEEHYLPRFAGDRLPSSEAGVCVALADKLEALVGMFGVGNAPTGEKDPFGLRRHCLGILRIVMENRIALPLSELLSLANNELKDVPQFVPATPALIAFMSERLRGLLRDAGYSATEIESVAVAFAGRIDELPEKLLAVRTFSRLPEAQSLASANKRIGNILKKAQPGAPIDPSSLVDPAEIALFDAMQRVAPEAQARFANHDYQGMLVALAALKDPVDLFFDKVMVMADDAKLRENRIALLSALHALMNQVADLSKLAG